MATLCSKMPMLAILQTNSGAIFNAHPVFSRRSVWFIKDQRIKHPPTSLRAVVCHEGGVIREEDYLLFLVIEISDRLLDF